MKRIESAFDQITNISVNVAVKICINILSAVIKEFKMQHRMQPKNDRIFQFALQRDTVIRLSHQYRRKKLKPNGSAYKIPQHSQRERPHQQQGSRSQLCSPRRQANLSGSYGSLASAQQSQESAWPEHLPPLTAVKDCHKYHQRESSINETDEILHQMGEALYQ